MASKGRVGWAARRAAYRLAEWLRAPQEKSLRSWIPCYGVERTPHTATAGALQDVRVDSHAGVRHPDLTAARGEILSMNSSRQLHLITQRLLKSVGQREKVNY
jgi:hypothetical protein